MIKEILTNEDPILPEAVEEWSGISQDQWGKVYSLNDGAHRSFAEIAEWIEANL